MKAVAELMMLIWVGLAVYNMFTQDTPMAQLCMLNAIFWVMVWNTERRNE